jgi:p-hydroxybenzoate 3-monooxygenase
MATDRTQVVIIGAGASGLTLATFLAKAGVPCVVLERSSRDHVQVRQRAGVVEGRAVGMFERWGLANSLLAGPVAQTIDYRVNGVSHIFELAPGQASEGRFCTQQMLVNNLLRELIDVMQGDVRFLASDVTIENEEDRPPRVTYTDVTGTHSLACDYIVGCDAEHGVSRASIPAGVLTRYSRDFGYAWLAALVEAPVVGHPIMGISDRGFVAQLPRGPQRSRYYLQCPLTDGPDEWPDQRVWDEIRQRTGNAALTNAVIHDKDFVPIRSVVYSPMQYRNLFLAGDAAHLLPPTGAKGMNLALHDVDLLAHGLVEAIVDRSEARLRNYSNEALPFVWRYQEFSEWMTDTMHDAGDASLQGEFKKQMALARLDAIFTMPAAHHLHSTHQQGQM